MRIDEINETIARGQKISVKRICRNNERQGVIISVSIGIKTRTFFLGHNHMGEEICQEIHDYV